jgi:phage-related baseplate assembly protein
MATRAFQTSDTWPADSDSRVAVKKPSTYALNVSAVLYHDPGIASNVIVERAETALLDFIAATPIGGYDYSPGPANVIMITDLADMLKDVEGVEAVQITTPTGNVSIGTLTLVIRGAGTVLTATPRISA